MLMRRVQDQSGAVLAIVAVSLVAFLGMSMIVVDLANWWVHKRHLQEQADAAVLAGSQLLDSQCGSSPSARNTAIFGEVSKYGLGNAALRNGQISLGGTESVLSAVNSTTYPDGQPGAAGDTETNTGSPCADAAVDVKLTDKNLPFLFQIGSLAHINVHARMTVQQVSGISGQVPFGIPISLVPSQTNSNTLSTLRQQGNTLTCTGDQNALQSDIQTGCTGWFRTAVIPPDDCTTFTVGTQAAPSPCVDQRNGDHSNAKQIGDGLNTRINGSAGASCTHPDNWPNVPKDDPRVVTLFVIQGFTSGNAAVPILGFASFYVSGWHGQGNQTDPCTPNAEGIDLSALSNGDVVGHYMTSVADPGTETPSDKKCVFDSPTPCVRVFTD
jgi:hypothetical protein